MRTAVEERWRILFVYYSSRARFSSSFLFYLFPFQQKRGNAANLNYAARVITLIKDAR